MGITSVVLSARRCLLRLLLFVLCAAVLRTSPSQAQERPTDSVAVSGLIIPEGPPSGRPLRVDAGASCVVDVVQDYRTEGDLEGALSINFRILVDGPCGEAPGTYDEEWIARGEATGDLAGEPYATGLTYTARVREGDISGVIVFGPDLNGHLEVTGRFEERRLRYSGWVARQH